MARLVTLNEYANYFDLDETRGPCRARARCDTHYSCGPKPASSGSRRVAVRVIRVYCWSDVLVGRRRVHGIVLQRHIIYRCCCAHYQSGIVEPHVQGCAGVLECGWRWTVNVLRLRSSTGEYDATITFDRHTDIDSLLAAAGAEAQFTSLYHAAYLSVRRYLMRMVGIADVDDLTAGVFTTVWERWSDIPAEPRSRYAWVFGVAHFKVREAIRARQRERGLMDRITARRVETCTNSPEEFVIALEQSRRILGMLPEAERDAIELTMIGGLTSRQAAEILGCSISAVTTRVSRARTRLAGLLAPKEVDNDS